MHSNWLGWALPTVGTRISKPLLPITTLVPVQVGVALAGVADTRTGSRAAAAAKASVAVAARDGRIGFIVILLATVLSLRTRGAAQSLLAANGAPTIRSRTTAVLLSSFRGRRRAAAPGRVPDRCAFSVYPRATLV